MPLRPLLAAEKSCKSVYNLPFCAQGTEDKSLLAGYVAMFLEEYNTAQVGTPVNCSDLRPATLRGRLVDQCKINNAIICAVNTCKLTQCSLILFFILFVGSVSWFSIPISCTGGTCQQT